MSSTENGVDDTEKAMLFAGNSIKQLHAKMLFQADELQDGHGIQEAANKSKYTVRIYCKDL